MRAQGERDGHIGRKVDSRTARIQKALLLWIISWQKFVVCVSRRTEHSLTPFFQCFDSVNILIGIDPEASSGTQLHTMQCRRRTPDANGVMFAQVAFLPQIFRADAHFPRIRRTYLLTARRHDVSTAAEE